MSPSEGNIPKSVSKCHQHFSICSVSGTILWMCLVHCVILEIGRWCSTHDLVLCGYGGASSVNLKSIAGNNSAVIYPKSSYLGFHSVNNVLISSITFERKVASVLFPSILKPLFSWKSNGMFYSHGHWPRNNVNNWESFGDMIVF